MKRTPRLDLNPSSADRWTTCTASPLFVLDNADRVMEDDKRYADEGTTAHELAAALLQGRNPDPKNCPVPPTPEMHSHAWDYMEFVEGLREDGGKLWVEQKMPLFYMSGRNAIVDAAVFNLKNAHVVDFKFGAGILVSPENNLQATIYGRQLMQHIEVSRYDDFPIHIHIYQPRARNAAESPHHTWSTTWGEIHRRSNEIAKTAKLIQDVAALPDRYKHVQFAPSKKACQWCPAKGFCEERGKMLTKDIQAVQVLDKQGHLPPAKGLSVRQLSAILTHREQIKKWLDDAAAYALEHMKGGGKLPGWKLVTSRGGNRYWVDPKKAAKLLLNETILKREEIIEETTISVAQVEKLLGKNKMPASVLPLITRPPGKPVIAPEDDTRESAMLDESSEFSNLDDDDFFN